MANEFNARDPIWNANRSSPAVAVADNFTKMGTWVVQDAVEAASTATVINATGHVASAGDQIIMSSGTYDGEGREVASVTTDTITLSVALSGAPTAADTFEIVTPIQQNAVAGAAYAHIHNGTNQPIDISFNGTTIHTSLLSLEEWFPPGRNHNLNAIERGDTSAKGFVWHKASSTAPSSGSIDCSSCM